MLYFYNNIWGSKFCGNNILTVVSATIWDSQFEELCGLQQSVVSWTLHYTVTWKHQYTYLHYRKMNWDKLSLWERNSLQQQCSLHVHRYLPLEPAHNCAHLWCVYTTPDLIESCGSKTPKNFPSENFIPNSRIFYSSNLLLQEN